MKNSNHIRLLSVFVLLSIPLSNYSQDIRFNHLLKKDGLIDSRVNKIIMDNLGYMWFATADGVTRYDGYQFKGLKNDPDDSNSLSSRSVKAIYVDHAEKMWFGLHKYGLEKYDPITEQLSYYPYSPGNPNGLSHARITDVLEDKNGLLWITTWGGGLNLFNRELETFTHFKHDSEKSNSLSSDYINIVVEDSTAKGSVLWVGTHLGLDRFDYDRQQFTHYQHDSTNRKSLNRNWINDISISSTGKLWIGSEYGVDHFDPETDQFTHYQHDPQDPNSLSSNLVLELLEDRSGNLWVATANQKLNRMIFDPSGKVRRVDHYKHDPFKPYSLNDDLSITDLYEDNSGSIWIAHHEGGIDRFDPATENFKNYLKAPGDKNSIDDNFINDVYQDPQGILWVSTELIAKQAVINIFI